MPKDKLVSVRLDSELLHRLSKTLGVDESKTIRACLNCADNVIHGNKNKKDLLKALFKEELDNIKKKKINKIRIKIYQRKYRKSNKKILNHKKKLYLREKRINDVAYKIKKNIQRRIVLALKGESKSKNTIELLGCSINYFKKHIEKKFTLGMNWKNYGYGWHLDHIIPCCKFDLSKKEDQLKCFNYKNVQPLWALENINKSGK